MIPHLVILCGLPGSGKTTFARRLEVSLPIVRLCPDEWKADLGIDYYDEQFRERLELRLIQLAATLLRLRLSVVLEFGFWGRSERAALRDMARSLAVPIDLYFFDVPLEELARRITIRNQQHTPGIVPIPLENLEQYAAIFLPQQPDADEYLWYDTATVVRDALHHPLPYWS